MRDVVKRRAANNAAHDRVKSDPARLAHHRKRQADYRRNRRRNDKEYRDRTQAQFRKSIDAAKENCINMYSNGEACCKWCPQSDIDVLCLDHIDEGQTKSFTKVYKHRGGKFLYARLRALGYPPGFQVLCANCNLKKEILRRREEKRARTHAKHG